MEVQRVEGGQVAGAMLGDGEPVLPVRVGPYDAEAGLLTLASLVVTHARSRPRAYEDRTGQALVACARQAGAETIAGHLSGELDRIRERGMVALARVGKLQDELADVAAQLAADGILLLGWVNKLEGDLQQLEQERDLSEERAA